MNSYSTLYSGDYLLALLLKCAAQRSFCGKLVSWSPQGKLLPKQYASTLWECDKLFLTVFFQYSPDLKALNGLVCFIYLKVFVIGFR